MSREIEALHLDERESSYMTVALQDGRVEISVYNTGEATVVRLTTDQQRELRNWLDVVLQNNEQST